MTLILRHLLLSLVWLTATCCRAPSPTAPSGLKWNRVRPARSFGLVLPADMRGSAGAGIDSFVGRYKNQALEVSFDLGIYNHDLCDPSEARRGEPIVVDRHKACVLEERREGRFAVTAHFPQIERHSHSELSIHVTTKERRMLPVAHAIVRRVLFYGPDVPVNVAELARRVPKSDRTYWIGYADLAWFDPKKRLAGLEALAAKGPDALGAAPVVIGMLADEDEAVRVRAARTLAGMGPRVLPALVRALEHRNLLVADGAAAALGHMGPAGAPAIDALFDSFSFSAGPPVGAANRALSAMGRSAVPRLRALARRSPKAAAWVSSVLLDMRPPQLETGLELYRKLIDRALRLRDKEGLSSVERAQLEGGMLANFYLAHRLCHAASRRDLRQHLAQAAASGSAALRRLARRALERTGCPPPASRPARPAPQSPPQQ